MAPPDVWNVEGFPHNDTQIDAFLEYATNVSKTGASYAASYIIQYPYWWDNLTYWKEHIAGSAEYKEALQLIINTIRENHPSAMIYLSSDMVERHFGAFEASRLPYDMENIDGFGFSYYTSPGENIVLKLNEHYMFFLRKSRQYAKGYVCYSEFGFKTNPESKTIEGLCENEAEKIAKIKLTLDVVKSWKIPVCYFLLHDFPYENADWGLIEADEHYTPRQSGLEMREIIYGIK